MISIFIGVGIPLAIGILMSPLFGLALTVILIPISTQQTLGGSFLGLFSMVTPIKIIGSLTFISTLMHYGSKKEAWDFLKKPQIRFFFLFLIWIFISGFAQPGFAARENFTMFISSAILGVIILILLQEIKKFRLVLRLIIVTMFFICIQAVLSWAGVDRAEGTGYGPNEFAIMILPFIAITLYMAISEKGMLRILSFISCTVIFLALLSTISRGGIIGFFAMILIAGVKAKSKIKAILLILVFSAIIVNIMPKQVWERFEKIKVEENSKEQDIGGTTRRYFLAKAAWQIFCDHPVFGIGIGNYYYECSRYQPVYAGRAHNMYLEIMAELGTVGITLFLGVILYTFKALNRVIKSKSVISGYAKGLFIGLVGFLVAGIFLHAQQDRVLWFLVFMSTALGRIHEKNYI